MASSPDLHTFSDTFESSSDTSRPSSLPSTSHPLSPSTSSPPSPTSRSSSPASTSAYPITNPDIKRLHATHHTVGYRDGISNSKTSFLQQGFDEGYALGAELGVRVGHILGILEGLRSAGGPATAADAPSPTAAVAVIAEEMGNGSRMKKILGEARRELVVEQVFGREWWGEDGIWRYETGEEGEGGWGGGESGGEEGEGRKGEEVTFAVVAESHPLLKRWLDTARAEMGRLGVKEGRFEGEEWEKGRG